MPVNQETSFGLFNEKGLNELDQSAEDGTGGGILEAWNSKDAIVNKLISGSFTNNSSFEIPAAVTESTANFGLFEEATLGVTISADFRDSDGTPLSGRYEITKQGNVVREATVSGLLNVTLGVPGGVESGSSVSSVESRDFEFVPTGSGLSYVEESITGGLQIGQIRYGSITGTVTDVNGNPVETDRVLLRGTGFFTDENGEYEIKGPGGVSATISGLRGSDSSQVQFAGGSVVQRDFQYGGLRVDVQIPDGTTIPGVLVDAGQPSGEKRTSLDGPVEFTQVPISGTITVTLGQDALNIDVASPQSGDFTNLSRTVGFGIKGRCADTDGSGIADLDMRINRENPLVARALDDGSYIVGDDEPGSVVLTFAQDDRRYERSDLEEEVSEGDVLEGRNVNLQRKQGIGNK